MSDRITLLRPDDWHIHLRDGAVLSHTVADVARQFARAIIMPNLVPPVRNADEAAAYRQRILAVRPDGSRFEPLMVLYLTDSTRAEILDSLRAGDERITALTAQRDELGAAVDERRTALFSDGGDGATILDRLRDAEAAAAATPVRGPGITVTLTEPTARPNLSDAARIEDRPTALVLDRDLQSVVNALWAAGAEAVEVGGVRVGPGVTIRQAGGAMLVDNRPVFSPYTVSAVGSPSRLQTTFVVSDAYLRIAGIQQLYGVGFTLAEEDDLEFPAATVRKLGSSGETGYR